VEKLVGDEVVYEQGGVGGWGREWGKRRINFLLKEYERKAGGPYQLENLVGVKVERGRDNTNDILRERETGGGSKETKKPLDRSS